MTTNRQPINRMLGGPGEPVQCKEFSADVSMHWYAPDAAVGDRCLCGKLQKKAER